MRCGGGEVNLPAQGGLDALGRLRGLVLGECDLVVEVDRDGSIADVERAVETDAAIVARDAVGATMGAAPRVLPGIAPSSVGSRVGSVRPMR